MATERKIELIERNIGALMGYSFGPTEFGLNEWQELP